jgi:hypothetical protein
MTVRRISSVAEVSFAAVLRRFAAVGTAAPYKPLIYNDYSESAAVEVRRLRLIGVRH